jgi:hypothetical protein
MDIFTFTGLLLCIIFMMFIFLRVFFQSNHIIGYQTIQNPNEVDYDVSPIKNDCRQFCQKEICDHYETELEDYKDCIQCKKKFQCYNVFTNQCENCISLGLQKCTFPIDPKNNFCNI